MGLEVPDVARFNTGVRVRGAQRLDLALDGRHHHRFAAAAVVAHGGAQDHDVHRVAVPDRTRQHWSTRWPAR